MSQYENDIFSRRLREINYQVNKEDRLFGYILGEGVLQGMSVNGHRDLPMVYLRRGNVQTYGFKIVENAPMLVKNPGECLSETTLVDSNTMSRLGKRSAVGYIDGLWHVLSPSIGNHHCEVRGSAGSVNALMSMPDLDYLRPDSDKGRDIWHTALFYLNPLSS